MSNQPARIKQSDAARLFKAAKAAGFSRARIISHPDGRIEMVGENGPAPAPDVPLSPFEKWKAEHADKD